MDEDLFEKLSVKAGNIVHSKSEILFSEKRKFCSVALESANRNDTIKKRSEGVL